MLLRNCNLTTWPSRKISSYDGDTWSIGLRARDSSIVHRRRYKLEDWGFDSRQEQENCFFAKGPSSTLGFIESLSIGCNHGFKVVRRVKSTTHLHLVHKLSMFWAMPISPQAFITQCSIQHVDSASNKVLPQPLCSDYACHTAPNSTPRCISSRCSNAGHVQTKNIHWQKLSMSKMVILDSIARVWNLVSHI